MALGRTETQRVEKHDSHLSPSGCSSNLLSKFLCFGH